jgi:poly(3-hydroxybutyrate) depolymerase
VETLDHKVKTDPTETLYFQFNDCPADGPVELYAVKEGGHRWHGTDEVLDNSGLGLSSQDFKASEVIWAFFQKFPVKEEK